MDLPDHAQGASGPAALRLDQAAGRQPEHHARRPNFRQPGAVDHYVRDPRPRRPDPAGAFVTLTLRGAGFTPATTASVLDPSGFVQFANPVYLDSNTLRVDVHLTNSVVGYLGGTFAVQVANGAQTATKAGALTIGAGSQSQSPPCPLTLSLVSPAAVKSLAEFAVTVNYQNDCAEDATPQVAVISSSNARLRFPGDSASRSQVLQLLLTNPGEGPLELIPPGAHGSILLMAQPITGGAHLAVPLELSPCSQWPAGGSTIRPA